MKAGTVARIRQIDRAGIGRRTAARHAFPIAAGAPAAEPQLTLVSNLATDRKFTAVPVKRLAFAISLRAWKPVV